MHLSVFVDAFFKVGSMCRGAKSHLKSISHSVTSNQSRRCDGRIGLLAGRKLWGCVVCQQQIISNPGRLWAAASPATSMALKLFFSPFSSYSKELWKMKPFRNMNINVPEMKQICSQSKRLPWPSDVQLDYTPRCASSFTVWGHLRT